MILSAVRFKPCDAGFTLVETLVAATVGTILATAATALSLYGAWAFAAITNYVDLDAKSRNTMDVVGRDLRLATALVSFQTNLPVRSLTLTNATAATTIKLTFDSTGRTLVFEKTGQAAQTVLTQCDTWNFQLYNRVPILSPTNIVFYSATNLAGQLDPTSVKLVNMSWRCSRQIRGTKSNTESVQTAQIVLRNKTQ